MKLLWTADRPPIRWTVENGETRGVPCSMAIERPLSGHPGRIRNLTYRHRARRVLHHVTATPQGDAWAGAVFGYQPRPGVEQEHCDESPSQVLSPEKSAVFRLEGEEGSSKKKLSGSFLHSKNTS
jgi:hypothetical protein